MLTDEQIQKIENLCNTEGIYFYDIRLEMIDHVAQGIEEKMQQNPELNFETALKEMARGAGIYKFSNIVEIREKEVLKNTERKAWKLFWEYLTIPKILLTCFLFIVFVSPKILFGISSNLNLAFIVLSAYSVMGGVYSFVKFKKPTEPLLSLPSKDIMEWGKFIWFIGNMLIIFKEYKTEIWFNSTWFLLLYAAFNIFAILFALAWWNAYTKIYNNLRKTYPIAFQK